MQWSDNAIILSARKQGETSLLLRVFAQNHGLFAGVFRGATAKTNRGIAQAGNIVRASWNARLSEQLGLFKCELLEANAALVMQDAGRLAALASACALVESALPERHPYSKLYGLFQQFLHELREGDDWPQAYVALELDLLGETGFGLDLSRCAATGTTENLIYVSPKSGRAVSAEVGWPYGDKLLKLPTFLLPPGTQGGRNSPPTPAEILAGMQLTGYFLEHWLLEPHRRKLPAARERLLQNMKEPHGTEV